MKMTEMVKHHKTHKYTITGFVVGGILLLVSLIDIMIKEPLIHPFAVYITIIPGIALILRSFRPPMGLVRSLYTLVGGGLVGAVPMMLTSDNMRIIWSGLACGLLGAAFLGASFTVKPKKAVHKTT